MEKLNVLKKRFYVVLGIILIIELFLAIFLIGNSGIDGVFYFMFMIIFSVAIFVIIYNEMVKKPFKMEFVGKILKEHKSNIEYTYKIDGEDYKGIIKKFKLIPSATSFKFRDVIDDEIEGVSYRSMDLHATHTQSTGKSSTTVTDFKGKV